MSFEKDLEALVRRVGAKGAMIVDHEGELVSGYKTAEDIELDLIGAHQTVIINMVREAAARSGPLGEPSSMGVTTEKVRLAISPIKDGYSLVVVMDTSRPLGRALFESRRCIKRLLSEF